MSHSRPQRARAAAHLATGPEAGAHATTPPANTPARPTAGNATAVAASVPIGVGIDTSRYGHYAAFLTDDLQPAAAELAFAESADGYAQLRQRLEFIARRHPAVTFIVRLDAAGQYADNPLHFLHQLADEPAQRRNAGPVGLYVQFTRTVVARVCSG